MYDSDKSLRIAKEEQMAKRKKRNFLLSVLACAGFPAAASLVIGAEWGNMTGGLATGSCFATVFLTAGLFVYCLDKVGN